MKRPGKRSPSKGWVLTDIPPAVIRIPKMVSALSHHSESMTEYTCHRSLGTAVIIIVTTVISVIVIFLCIIDMIIATVTILAT